MSFLAGRLAGTEGAYFLQESKHAVGRLVQKNKAKLPSPSSSSSSNAPASSFDNEALADILPEVSRHHLPLRILQPPSESSLPRASKWVLHSEPTNVSTVSPDALNPLRAYVSLPQVTFGPKRWQLPIAENSISASTANELRHDRNIPVNSEKLKAAAVGLSQISKAFAIATAIVFGGATLVFGLAASKLDLHNGDDIRTKGKNLVQPRFELVRGRLIPLRTWAEDTSKKWSLGRKEDVKEKPLVKELSKVLGAKRSN